MAGTKEIKRRIKSIKNTKKITKAMELVAASKMKRAVSSTLASRLYAEYSWEVLSSVADSLENTDFKHPLFETQKEGKTLLVLITSNRGLCGAYNAQAIKRSLVYFKNEKPSVDILAIGKKGDTAMRRVGKNVVASFVELPDQISLRDTMPISKMLVDEYMKGVYGKVVVVYTDFISALTQKANLRQVIPVRKESLAEFIKSVGENIENVSEQKKVPTESRGSTTAEAVGNKTDYLFEGDKTKLIGDLAEKLTRMQIYQMLLESNASEQSSRMMAMKNATEASGEMIDDLTLVFNKARQSNITREISEISAGMASVS